MRLFFGVGLVVLCGGMFWVWHGRGTTGGPAPLVQETITESVVEPVPPVTPSSPVSEKTPVTPLPETVLIPDVPFMVQAPLAQWSDPLFQDACEEAAIIMAQAWVKHEPLTVAGVTETIRQVSKFEKKHFGQAVDTSITDTAWLLEQYFGVTGVVHPDVTIDDMKRALAAGEIVIVPTDGRKLKNPNFKRPGPTHHMVVVIGYDQQTHEFITNDPGTRRGKQYHYPEAVLYEAVLDYATGDHLPATSTAKVMLSVSRD